MKPPECPKVYYRIVPQEKICWDYVKILYNNKTIYVQTLQGSSKRAKSAAKYWSFETDGVFYSDTQTQIYNCVTSNVLNNVINGQDAVILAFGQTGTGKSSTIGGLDFNYEHRGILPRAISDLFKLQKTFPKHIKTCICINFVEIDRNHIYDLLQPYPSVVKTLKDVQKSKVRNEDEALKMLFTGEGRREAIALKYYLSHLNTAIFTLHFYTKNTHFQPAKYTESKLHIIDLAGVDTVGNFTCLFKDPAEIGGANLAKSQLEQFFLVLAKNVPANVKVSYNINAMLHYLGDSLSNSTLLRFIGHIKVGREDLTLTMSMLRFGQIISRLSPKQFEIAAKSTYEPSTSTKDVNTILLQQDLSVGLNDERVKHIERTMNEFLQNKITKTALFNVCDPATALEVLKVMCKTNESTSSQKLNSSKPSSSNLLKKRSFEKKSAKSSISSAKSSTNKKGSTTSLLKKTSTMSNNKRKSSSGASVLNEKATKSRSFLMPEVIPEFQDAWTSYISEREINYNEFVNMYKLNEELGRKIYKQYLQEVQVLKQLENQLEDAKETLIIARFTQELQQNNASSNKIEECAAENLNKVKESFIVQQEKVLELQSDIKMHVGRGKEIKKELKENFEEYCREKFDLPIENIAENPDEHFMDIEKILTDDEKKEEIEETSEMNEINKFESYKQLKLQARKEVQRIKDEKKREWVGIL